MDTQVYSRVESNGASYCSNTEQASVDPRVTLDKYLPAEWHIYVLPRLRMGVVLGNEKNTKSSFQYCFCLLRCHNNNNKV